MKAQIGAGFKTVTVHATLETILDAEPSFAMSAMGLA